jgi:uncharacterized membrane protein
MSHLLLPVDEIQHGMTLVGWNLMLAVIPVALGGIFWVLVHRPYGKAQALRGILAAVVIGAWLAFVPNTCYLLTEWRHFLDVIVDSNLWRRAGGEPKLLISAQALFYFFYSGAGLLCFVLAIRPVERALRLWKVPFPLVAVPLFILISLGVYLGLVLRLNSWDIVSRPHHVIKSVWGLAHNRSALTAIGAFAAFLWGLYEALDIWVDGIVERIQRHARPQHGPPPRSRKKA